MWKGRTMSIGVQLKTIMEKEKISGYRISKETGIQPSYIGRLLRDKTTPNYSTLKRVLDVLGYEVRFVKSKKGKS
jgi:transcriptional regulator with XRE-family HTH domain